MTKKNTNSLAIIRTAQCRILKESCSVYWRQLLVVSVFSGCLLAMAGCSSSSSRGQTDLEGVARIPDEDLALEASRYGEGNIPQARGDGLFEDIMFLYDSAVVDSQYHEVLQQNAKVMMADGTLHAEVEGHCDKRGTNEYNLALGEERAKAVASMLVSFGARSSQISTISYGEEIPVDPGNNEDSFARNRRVHFALYRVKDARK